ncbi:MAG: oxidoreductase [Acidiferrobacteraceae bacterium]|nr:oxidoreductase [Acidiferrobacteraceae bacterium]
MSARLNSVKRGLFLDSVILMQISRTISKLENVEDAAVMMGTPANQEILNNSNLLTDDGKIAKGGDLIIAVRASDEPSAHLALNQATSLIERPVILKEQSSDVLPATLRAALDDNPNANLALISVPGEFAAAEAWKALRAGLDVMIFSDNVSIEAEAQLKQEARKSNRIVMGPDCGTAILAGVPLAFANEVPAGNIGIIGASGTGIQEVVCLIARAGFGISHAIGVGGRDLSDPVGGLSTLTAIELLDSDPATEHIVLISKPPSERVVKVITKAINRSRKFFTVCFLGSADYVLPNNAVSVKTLKAAAVNVTKIQPDTSSAGDLVSTGRAGAKWIRGLYSGGSLSSEAQVILISHGLKVASNSPIVGADLYVEPSAGHVIIDLGDDKYTVGRPHPMIEPAVRDQPLLDAFQDPSVKVILLDLVLGYGSSLDPADHIASLLQQNWNNDPTIIASVTGTEYDPQVFSRQVDILHAAGVYVAPSNADAAEAAVKLLSMQYDS